MPRVLVVTEKPSVARSIAAVLGAAEKHNGYLEGNGYLVSWCIGHLVELAAPSGYDDKYNTWNKADLPILPEPWQYTVQSGTKAQFTVLKQLMNDPRVESIICATDAGREGELIFRLVYNQCGCRKPVQRLWISSMEDAAIREGFENLKPSTAYDSLYHAALCRAQADWLVGINATRLFSTMYNKTLNIGRVMTPTLSMIVSREAQVSAFQPELFYHAQLNCGGLNAQSERLQSKEAAEHIAALCNGKIATVSAVQIKEKAENPPKLFDLTALQRSANRLLGYTAQQTLDYAQSLYEKKLSTYPRTDSRYLTTHAETSTYPLVQQMAKALPFLEDTHVDCLLHRVIDSNKVSDHHAILPTESAATFDTKTLTAGERHILTLLMVRLLCAVNKTFRSEETTATLECEGVSFTLKGHHVLDEGWKEIEKAYRSTLKTQPEYHDVLEPSIPPLEQGMSFPGVSTTVKEGQTSPPKHFTEDTLLSSMETAAMEDSAVEVERKGLGTPATRAGIIEKLMKTGFVKRKKGKKGTILLPTEKGGALITLLPEELQSPELTAEWEGQLRKIEKGELPPNTFMQGICEMVENLVRTSKPIKDAHILFLDERPSVGICPRCGSTVRDGPKGFSCANRDCRFVIWKNSRFFTAKRMELTVSIVAALLKDGQVMCNGLYSEKTGKTYDATVLLDDTGGDFVNFKLQF